MSASRILFYLLLACAALSMITSCAGKRTTKDWGKMDFDALEKQWEEGDEEEELKTERQLEFERLERRRKQAAASSGKIDPSMLSKMGPAEIGALAAGQKDSAGPTMMFAEVGPASPAHGGAGSKGGEGGQKLTQDETSELGGRLQQFAQLGGLTVSVYAIDPGSVLVSTQKGWEGKEILDFLLSRPEVSKVTWNSKDFFPPVEDEL